MKRIIAMLAGLGLGLAMIGATISPAAAQPAPDRATVEGLIYKPMPIAIPEMNGSNNDAKELSRQITGVIRNDLENSAVFRLIDPKAFVQTDLDLQLTPRFPDWTVISAQGLLVGKVEIDGARNVVTEFRLYDVYRGAEVFARRYSVGTSDNWRRVAHKIADDIYRTFTGEEGYFDTRIVFVSENTNVTPHRRRLAIMDQDGANAEHLISGGDFVQTARFSPDPEKQEIIYTAVVNDERNPQVKRTRVYLYDIKSGRRELLTEGTDPDPKFAARFSPDGRSVVFSKGVGGNTDLYLYDIARRTQKRLTDEQSIETSPSFSPDGQFIVFTSDRTNSEQLYIMRTDGAAMNCPKSERREACLLSSGGDNYSRPVWSPRGDWIAFCVKHGDRYSIGVIKPDAKDERLLTDSYLDEGPTWSPNGRVIAFSREAGPGAGSKLWTIDLSGRNPRQLKTPNDASDPAWSPLLK